MFEVARKNFIGKSRNIFDNERAAIFSPGDNVLVLWVLNDELRYINDSKSFS
jgi:hypothetical protein